jgi:hypothetical protein
MPERLGDAYVLLLRLGRFLETDVRMQGDREGADDRLEPAIHGILTDLVRTAAPWLRGFPTVAAWDDAAGHALVRTDLFGSARAFTRIARRHQTISERDADQMELLAETTDFDDYQGTKSGNRTVGGAKNLMIAAAGTIAASLSQTIKMDLSTTPLLVQRAAAVLVAAEEHVRAFAATMPDDLRQAFYALIKEGQWLGGNVLVAAPGSLPQSIPVEVEQQARAMILNGYSPPSAWIIIIRQLNFHGTALESLDLLSTLTALRSLDLTSTRVSDLSPLVGLTSLQGLTLRGAQVNDVSPLSSVTVLKNLDLRATQVIDVSPLSRLTALRSLDLTSTRVSDLSPLVGLTDLQTLDLADTRIADVSPLAGLIALQRLDVAGTVVSDVSPLAGLAALQSLDMASTRVVDVSPLYELTGLRSLNLTNTLVKDLSPLSGLTALQTLSLRGTQVNDVSPLARLTALRDLDLTGTLVTDVSPLSKLTSLKSLNLTGARVAETSSLNHLGNLEILPDRRDRASWVGGRSTREVFISRTRYRE